MSEALKALDEIEMYCRDRHGYALDLSLDSIAKRLPTLRAALAPAANQIRALQDAIEGECGGIAISEQSARNILSHIGAQSDLAPVTDDTFGDDFSRYASVHDDADIWERQRAERWLWENRATLLRRDAEREAELAKEREENERLRHAIHDVLASLENDQTFYDRNGPAFTSPAGYQYEHTADVLACSAERAQILRAALEPKP